MKDDKNSPPREGFSKLTGGCVTDSEVKEARADVEKATSTTEVRR